MDELERVDVAAAREMQEGWIDALKEWWARASLGLTRRANFVYECPCGLARLLRNVRLFDAFQLAPCPRCQRGMKGRFFGWFLWRS